MTDTINIYRIKTLSLKINKTLYKITDHTDLVILQTNKYFLMSLQTYECYSFCIYTEKANSETNVQVQDYCTH